MYVPRLHRPHVAPRARSLTLQTAQRARRAKWELAILIPLFGLTLVAYIERERFFGVDTPVRVAAAVVMVILGWALARDLGRFTAPANSVTVAARSCRSPRRVVRSGSLIARTCSAVVSSSRSSRS